MPYQFTQTGAEIQDILDLARNDIAAPYDPTASYVAGNYCTYEDSMYICTGSTTGAWDSTKWTATTVGSVLETAALVSSGTWTPTMTRATLSSASGKWTKIGSIVFLSCTLTFASSQTDAGNIYIDGSSMPSVLPSSCAIFGGGGGATINYACATYSNKNAWISKSGVGRIQASTVASETIYFGMVAVPR